jgi:hypothetical protein
MGSREEDDSRGAVLDLPPKLMREINVGWLRFGQSQGGGGGEKFSFPSLIDGLAVNLSKLAGWAPK